MMYYSFGVNINRKGLTDVMFHIFYDNEEDLKFAKFKFDLEV